MPHCRTRLGAEPPWLVVVRRRVRGADYVGSFGMTTITDDAFVRLFQERGGLDPDGWAGNATIALLDQLMPPKPSTDPNAAAGENPNTYEGCEGKECVATW